MKLPHKRPANNAPAKSHRGPSIPPRDYVLFCGVARKVKKRSATRITFENGQHTHPANISVDGLTKSDAIAAQKERQHLDDQHCNSMETWRKRWLRRSQNGGAR